MPDALLYPNGIDAETAETLLPPLPVEVVAALARGQAIAQEELNKLRDRKHMLKGEADYGVMVRRDAPAGVNPNNVAQAGDRYRDEITLPRFFYRAGETPDEYAGHARSVAVVRSDWPGRGAPRTGRYLTADDPRGRPNGRPIQEV